MIERRDFLAGTAAAVAAAAALPRDAEARDWSGQEPVRYPDPAIEVLDPRFARYRLGNVAVERLYTGTRWAEGPVWFGDGRYLLWSDIPNDRIMRWVEETGEVSVFREPAHNTNGHTRDKQGRLISCEHGSRSVTRTEHDGTVVTLIDSFEGKRLNAPNDAVVHPDGHIWFTDPGYGILMHYEGNKAEFELPTRVYRLNPETGEATVVSEEVEKPNGLCFSPDHKRLYVAETGATHKPDHPHEIRVFGVEDGARLVKSRQFAEVGAGLADGVKADTDGNIWASAGWAGEGYDGVQVFAPDGAPIGRINLPEVCSNLCFGGAKRNRLFMTASQSLYSVYVEAQGAAFP